jgi:hypothetical protein
MSTVAGTTDHELVLLNQLQRQRRRYIGPSDEPTRAPNQAGNLKHSNRI